MGGWPEVGDHSTRPGSFPRGRARQRPVSQIDAREIAPSHRKHGSAIERTGDGIEEWGVGCLQWCPVPQPCFVDVTQTIYEHEGDAFRGHAT